MSPSRTLFIGMDVHKEAIAVASVTQEHGAEGTSLGTIGTRPCAIDPLRRTRPAKATQLLCVSDAGPCGDWLSRDLTTKGDDCWVVAPSLLPQQAGERVKTDRRDAVHLARLARSGDLPPVDVPQVEDDAMRALRRAREEGVGALTAATFRRTAG
jgi:transposase